MQPSTADPIESARHFYAEELCRINRISSPAILAAFATVPRERFVGPGPWMIQNRDTHWFTESADPRNVYRDALIVLDEAKRLNNGQPSLWAFHLSLLDVRPGDQILHLGCGTGYYTAILAELTGPQGKVVAVEIDEGLAARARVALEPWPQVAMIQADGALGPFDPADKIVVSAGATHPLPAWLAALKTAGTLVFPLTSTRGPGTMAYVTRKSADLFAAVLTGSVFFVDFAGAPPPPAPSHATGSGGDLGRAPRHRGSRATIFFATAPDELGRAHRNGWRFRGPPPAVTTASDAR